MLRIINYKFAQTQFIAIPANELPPEKSRCAICNQAIADIYTHGYVDQEGASGAAPGSILCKDDANAASQASGQQFQKDIGMDNNVGEESMELPMEM